MIILEQALQVVPRSHQGKEWRARAHLGAPAKNQLSIHHFRRLPTFRLLALVCNLLGLEYLNGIDHHPSTNLLLPVHTLLLLPRTHLLPKLREKQCRLRLRQQTQSIRRQKALQYSQNGRPHHPSLLSSDLRLLLLLLARRRVSWLHSHVLPTWSRN